MIGHAARDEGLNVDDVVFVGSPGVGVANVGQLNVPADHVYSTVAEHDMIQVANTGNPLFDPHGPDPTSGGFGAHVFTSDPGTPGPGGTYSGAAHSQYWEKNNDALKNMGRVIAGVPTY